MSDGYEDRVKSHEGKDRRSAAPPAPLPKPLKRARSEPERRAGVLVNILQLRIDSAENDIASGTMTEASAQKTAGSIQDDLDTLAATLKLLPAGDPLIGEAALMQVRAGTMVTRLAVIGGGQTGQAGSGTQGLSAADFGRAPDIGKVVPAASATRGVGTLHEVGDQYIDYGAKCDDKDESTPGCFLSDGQRSRLIDDLAKRIVTVQMNYKFALEQMRVDELIKKDDDLNWVLSLALDTVSSHFFGVAVKALKGIKGDTLGKLSEIGLGEVHGAEIFLARISDDNIKDKTKMGFDLAKKAVGKSLKISMNQGDRNDKQISLSYLQQLQIDCDVGFDRFWANLRASASDAELVVAYHSLKDPRDHAVDLYKAVLTAKLDAYKKSGVEDIGRKARLDREYHVGTIHRDTRVIWVKNPFSEGKKLYFQSQEGDFNPTFLEKDDPGTEWMPENYHLRTIGPRKFGARDPRESPKLEKVVPVEFQEAAIARSEQIYGPTETVDPNDWLRRQGIDPDLVFRGTKQQDQRADLKGSEPDARSLTPFPPGSVFNSSPPAYPAGSVFNKTSDDVGDDLLQAYAGPIDFSSGKEP